MQRPRRSQEPKLTATAWWSSLEPLLRDKSVGGATKFCFGWLWWRTGGRPGNVSVTYGLLGATFGKSHRAAHKWVAQLAERGLVEIIKHDDRTGVLDLYVEAPGQMIRPRAHRPDPQQHFPGFPEGGPSDDAPEAVDTISMETLEPDLCAHKGPDVCAHKGPSPQGTPPHASVDRPTDRPVDGKEVDWVEVQRRSIKAARYVPIKSGKTARLDAEGLLAAALLSLTRLPESCFADAVDATRRKTDTKNHAAYFRKCFGEHAAKHFNRPEKEGPRVLAKLERASPIPEVQVRTLLDAVRDSRNVATSSCPSGPPRTAEELADAKEANAAILKSLKATKPNCGNHPDPKLRDE